MAALYFHPHALNYRKQFIFGAVYQLGDTLRTNLHHAAYLAVGVAISPQLHRLALPGRQAVQAVTDFQGVLYVRRGHLRRSPARSASSQATSRGRGSYITRRLFAIFPRKSVGILFYPRFHKVFVLIAFVAIVGY